jgi:hypothetical protein
MRAFPTTTNGRNRMTAASNLNTIAIGVVGHYGRTAKNLLATYRAGTERAVGALSAGYEQLLKKQPLPWLDGEIKARLVDTEQRLSRLVVNSVARFAAGANKTVDRVSGRTVQGIEAFDKQTAWANDLMVVGAIRKVNLPVARLSLRIAGRIDEASHRLSQRVVVPVKARAKAQATRVAKTAVKRARRAVRGRAGAAV